MEVTYSQLLELIKQYLEEKEQVKNKVPPRIAVAWNDELKPFLIKKADSEEDRYVIEIEIDDFYLLW